jgi:hypothetical protein
VKSTAECRSADGFCDVAEECDGVDDLCPPDAFESSAVECRPAAGECDITELCTGDSAACPDDEKSEEVCSPSSGQCDPEELCDGISVDCPADVLWEDGEECDDGNPSTIDDVCHPGGECYGELQEPDAGVDTDVEEPVVPRKSNSGCGCVAAGDGDRDDSSWSLLATLLDS